jgi:hypothetical protein
LNVRFSHLATTFLLVLGGSCVTAPLPERLPSEELGTNAVSSTPTWVGQPPSWSKLAAIERWLSTQGPSPSGIWVNRAHLELGEGRLTLAQRERREIPANVLAFRLHAAEADFQAVLDASGVPALERQRATSGLAELRKLQQAGGTTAASGPVPGLDILGREAWHPAATIARRLDPVGGPYTRITVHHSARTVPEEIGRPTPQNVAHAIQDIQRVHMRDKGCGDIGYHFLIDPEGRIWQGRSLQYQGAHAFGSNNVGNIGICLFGNFNVERPDPRALAALERLTDALCERHHIARSQVFGHRQMRGTECPGDRLMAWVARYSSGATH